MAQLLPGWDRVEADAVSDRDCLLPVGEDIEGPQHSWARRLEAAAAAGREINLQGSINNCIPECCKL